VGDLVPRSAQTGAKTLAQKGLAGGLHCLQVDGNDLIAVLDGMRRASERARNGEGGSVIEFLTYRLPTTPPPTTPAVTATRTK
jgi:pyruvate dehydrogenase E1 component alpha subunit